VREATLCFLLRGEPPDEILMGYKKVGFGAGKWSGFGGKIEPGEAPAQAAAREMEEEAGVRIPAEALQAMGELVFRFPFEPTWNHLVYVFLATAWEGKPTESREMSPSWFSLDSLPFEGMWQDGAHWLPRILAGERIQAHFCFGSDNETIEQAEIGAWNGRKLEKS